MWKSILAPALVVSSFWLMVGGSTNFYLFWQGRTLDRLLAENIASVRAANELQGTVWKIHSVLLQAASQKSATSIETLEELRLQLEQSLSDADSSSKVQELQTRVKQIRVDIAEFSARSRQMADNGDSNLPMLLSLLPLLSRITDHCTEIIRFNEHYLRETAQRRQQLTMWVVCGRMTMLVIGPSLGLLMGFRLAGQLRRSMTNISVSLQTVAGDLAQDVGQLEISSQPDLPAIQRQLDVIAERIRGVVRELHESRRETMQAERLAAVGELAAGVAHELRNPLTSVKLLIQTMQHRLQKNVPEQTFDIVLEEIQRMETTIQGLLDFARPPNLHRTLHDLRTIVRRALNLSDGKARQCGVEVRMHFAEKPVWVNADAEQLHQVCINLILNGIESMPDGGTLDVHVIAEEAVSMANVRFDDNGEGIPESIMPRLFEPFVSSKPHGTGLGLAVSRRIVVNHAGRLTAENRPDGGAALTITLPLEDTPAPKGEFHAYPVAG